MKTARLSAPCRRPVAKEQGYTPAHDAATSGGGAIACVRATDLTVLAADLQTVWSVSPTTDTRSKRKRHRATVIHEVVAEISTMTPRRSSC